MSDASLKVRVMPRSSVNRVEGFDGDALRVKVKSVPADGIANRDLIRVLSRHLRVPQASVEIVSGHKSRLKTIRFRGMRRDDLFQLLNR